MAETAFEGAMKDTDKYRRRLRGYAGFFCAIGLLQCLMGGLGFLLESYLTFEGALGYCLSGGFFVSAALMSWHGARSGAVAILLFMVFTLAVEVLFGSVQIAATVRDVIYSGLALRMCINAFRHWKAAACSEDGHVRGLVWVRWGGLVFVIPFAALSLVGAYFTMSPNAVSNGILSARDIPGEQLEWMRERAFLFEDETPLLFYSAGISSIAEDGNLLTDKFIGSWWRTEEGEVMSSWGRLGTICEITTKEAGALTGIATYTVHLVDSDVAIEIWLPVNDPLHDTFLGRLDYLNDRHTNPEFRSACEDNRPVNWKRVARYNGLPVGITEGEELTSSVENWLRGKDFLMPGEEPMWFFTQALYEMEESGTLMTDIYFGGWYQDQGIIEAVWFDHGEICTIELQETDVDAATQTYRVAGPGEERWLTFDMPLPEGEERMRELREINSTYQTANQAKACETGIDPKLVEAPVSEPASDAAGNMMPSEEDT